MTLIQGKILFYADVEDGLVISDPGWMMSKLGDLMKHKREKMKGSDLGLRQIPHYCNMLQFQEALEEIGQDKVSFILFCFVAA